MKSIATDAGAGRHAGGGRLAALDLLRGLIIVLMAVDHASYFVARRHRGEFWGIALRGYESSIAFLTRFVTHLAAPGFFFLMGASIVFMAESRRRDGWTAGRITRFLATRGLLLILLQQLVENPAWVLGDLASTAPPFGPPPPGRGGPETLHFGVLYGLGAAMIVCGVLVAAPTMLLALLGAGAILLTHAVLPPADEARVLFSPAARLLAIPGRTGAWQVFYPLLPWFGVAALGMGFGRALRADAERVLRGAWMAGVACLTAFVAVRTLGGTFLNVHPFAGGGWMDYLNVVKYPPSIAFLLLTLGTNLVLLSMLHAAAGRMAAPNAPLMVFGQSALAFYLLHLYVYLALGLPWPGGASWPVMYAMWAVGLVLLYPACRAWRAFKQRRPPHSVARLF